jgi:hypothetical protein
MNAHEPLSRSQCGRGDVLDPLIEKVLGHPGIAPEDNPDVDAAEAELRRAFTPEAVDELRVLYKNENDKGRRSIEDEVGKKAVYFDIAPSRRAGRRTRPLK